MDNAERCRILEVVAKAVGDISYNRLIDSIKETRHLNKLRFWQEEMLQRAGISISTTQELLLLFEGAKRKPTGRSKDALTAATTSYLIPILRDNMFNKYGKRSFGRIMDNCIFQYMDLQLSAWGGRSFTVNYTSIIMTRNRENISSTIFHRLPHGKSLDGWWDARSHAFADESMQEIVDKFISIALPWFNSTSTAPGLSGELNIAKKDNNPHTYFELACCYVASGNVVAARPILQEAIHRFQDTYEHNPNCVWALEERSLAEELVAAIAEGTHEDLLSKWRKKTIENLKLHKISV